MPSHSAASRLPKSEPAASSGLDEIRSLVLKDLPPLPAAAPAEALGDLAPAWRWLAAAQHAKKPEIRHPRVALFMASHGACPELQKDTGEVLSSLKNGAHAVSPLVQDANADLQVYELDAGKPSRDFRVTRALDAEDAAQAIAYGMMAVQPGVDFLLLAALNPVADMAAAEIARALKVRMDALNALLRFGGFDIAAMTGAIIAARLARIPVLLDGAAAEAAGAILHGLKADAASHAKKSGSLFPAKTLLPAPCSGALLIPLLKSIARAA